MTAVRPSFNWDDDKDHYVYENRAELDSQAYDGTAMLELFGSTGRIRPPRGLVPPINSGGDDGWWPLSDVSVGRDTIQARLRFNGFSKPRITVDRRAGRLTIENEPASFRGTCDPVDERDHRRF